MLFLLGFVLGVVTPVGLFYLYALWIQKKYQPH